MPGQISNGVKEERAQRAAQVAGEMERAYLESLVGQTMPVLFEEMRDGLWQGHTTRYTQAAVLSEEDLHNQVRQVRFTQLKNQTLLGQLV